MKHFISAMMIFAIKIVANLFFKIETKWLLPRPVDPWKNLKDVKLVVILNHTSLYEPIFIGAFPFAFLWSFTKKVVFPIASKTLERPIVGLFWKLLAPKKASLTRQKDDSWTQFLDMIDDDTHIAITPEGRMKRPNGLDLHGNKMTVRGGISDILERMNSGKMLIMYSGGLHHIQAPGQTLPKFFKKIKLNLQIFDIKQYKAMIESKGGTFKTEVVRDLQHRLENNCPSMDE